MKKKCLSWLLTFAMMITFIPISALPVAAAGVSDLLNTRTHDTYLSGYGNGLFGTEDNMTRAQVCQMFYNLLSNKNVTITAFFEDVEADAWYAKAVNTLASIGAVKGVGENKFEPNRSITRAEFAVIASKFAKASNTGRVSFSDVSSDAWYYESVLIAANYGWINGYSNGTFRPDATITRAEVTTIVNRMLAREADERFIADETTLVQFTDVSKSHWAYGEIMEAANGHGHSYDENRVESWTSLH